MSLFYLACAIVATVIAQLSFKFFFNNKNYLFLIVAVVFFVTTPILTFFALKGLSLSFVYMYAGLVYAFVPLLAVFFLKENMSKRQIYAVMLIVSGVVVFNF